jgi:hypothetical protein
MADNNFRPYRSRDPLAPRSTDAPSRAQPDDPLAELARLIGQSDPGSDYGRDTEHGAAPPLDEPAAGGLDWAADDRYAEPNDPSGDGYDARYDPRNEQAQPEPPPLRRPPPPQYDRGYEAPPASQFSEPAPRLNGPRETSRGYAPPPAPVRYRDQQQPPEPTGRSLPAFLPRMRDERYGYDDQSQDDADDQAYGADDYEDEAPNGRRRSGFVVVAAVLGLAVLGTAGAFAYRAMFGDSMLPSLPPIIKADDGPNKIVPANNASTPDQQNASDSNSGEKLVSREEQPVNMPAPVNPAPRVVSTIPIFPDPNSAQAGNVQAPPVPPASAAPMTSAPPMPVAPAAAPAAASAMAPVMGMPAPKKIHTVAIEPDQMGGPGPNMAATAQMPMAQSAPAAAAAPRPVRPAPAPRVDPNAPLSIIPGQADAAPPAPAPVRTHTAMAEPTPIAPSAGGDAAAAPSGGYAVQVTSQRSAAEAKTAFRALAAKYPDQLGGHEPLVRRADLGDKGIYYRALVGPFASMEQAAGLCSNLKAAGGNCIVQKN